MENASFATLTRQAGLKAELQVLANNIANASTVGFQREGVLFAEHVRALADESNSLSMAWAEPRYTDRAVGGHRATGGRFDFAIAGEGYFQIQVGNDLRLSRAGAFAPNQNGDLATPDGDLLLDAGGAPVPIPPGAQEVMLSADGTLSVDGFPVSQLGLVMPADPNAMTRGAGTSFIAEGGTIAVQEPQILQGYLESSNVNPITEITRLIEVQRAYEKGAKLLGQEDERIRAVIRTLGQS
ncbi:MAG: flagellar hook-basal body complex protein [Mangrovicoccus sp.]|nr:flagellar hook-basal body complex protein [Mangrovicoccus sp.]